MAKHDDHRRPAEGRSSRAAADWQAELSSAGVDSRITDSELRVQTHDLSG